MTHTDEGGTRRALTAEDIETVALVLGVSCAELVAWGRQHATTPVRSTAARAARRAHRTVIDDQDRLR